MDPDLPLSLDDFIPPHLQKRQNRGASQTYNAYTDSLDEGDLCYRATLVLTDDSLDTPSPQTQRRYIRYEGIGPTDQDGMPFASRSSVDKPREWYKNMYKVLHQMSDSEDSDSDGNRSKPENNHKEDFTVSNKSTHRFITEEKNIQSGPKDPSKRSQETSHLHVTVKSTIREPPRKSSDTLKSEPHAATTLPRPSSRQPPQTSPHYSLKVPSFVNNYDTARSSPDYSTQQSRINTSSGRQTSEPGPRHFFPDQSFHGSQTNKETSSLERLQQRSNYSSLGSTASSSHILSPTRWGPRKSTTKVLEQLETDLRNFTEELDKDLEARPETTLKQCEDVINRRYSHRAGGSPEPKANKSSRQHTEEQNLSPISKAVVKFDFVAESEKEISLQRGTAVNILKKVDEHWLLGEQDGRKGLFPESYVRVLSPGQLEPFDAPQLSGVALYDFKADSAAELPLRKVSSTLTLKERPCTVKAPVSNRLQELQGTMYRVLFNYSPKDADELQLSAGDIVTVTQRCEDGWYVGVCWRTQKFGTFPGNFVTPYETP